MKFEKKAADVNDHSYDRPLPPGEYIAVVLRIKEAPSKTSGKPMLTIGFGIDGGPEGGVRVDYRVIEPEKSSSFRSRLFAGLGYQRFDQEGGEFDIKDWVGLEAKVKTNIEKNQFKEDRPNIRDITPIIGPNEPKRRYIARPPEDESESPDGSVPFEV